MAVRPSGTDQEATAALKPPAVIYLAWLAGVLALAGSAPVAVMLRAGDYGVVERFAFGGPLPLLSIALWAFAVRRFIAYADARRRADEDAALIDAAVRRLVVLNGRGEDGARRRPSPRPRCAPRELTVVK